MIIPAAQGGFRIADLEALAFADVVIELLVHAPEKCDRQFSASAVVVFDRIDPPRQEARPNHSQMTLTLYFPVGLQAAFVQPDIGGREAVEGAPGQVDLDVHAFPDLVLIDQLPVFPHPGGIIDVKERGLVDAALNFRSDRLDGELEAGSGTAVSGATLGLWCPVVRYCRSLFLKAPTTTLLWSAAKRKSSK